MFQIKTTYNSGFYDTKMGGNRLNSASAGFSNMLNKQSPKILSGKLREQKLPFSIADVPVTKIANGTCLPAQYLRREDNEKEILTNKTTTKSSDTKSITKLEFSSREDAVRRNVKDKTHSPPKDNVITEKYFEIKSNINAPFICFGSSLYNPAHTRTHKNIHAHLTLLYLIYHINIQYLSLYVKIFG